MALTSDKWFVCQSLMGKGLVRLRLIRAALQIIREADLGEREDQPLRRIEVIPLGPIAIVAQIHVVIIVIALAERDQRNPPTVPAAVLRAVGLRAPDVADRIDA